MGFTSYYEDIVERRIDDAMMAPVFGERLRRDSPSQCVTTTVIFLNPPLHAASRNVEDRASRIAKTVRELREMHILCFAELRPKARSHHYV
jgi:hypothetical protein